MQTQRSRDNSREGSTTAGRSLLLIVLSYPLLLAGLGCLATGITGAGATLTACAVFLIGVTELCVSLSRIGEAQPWSVAESQVSSAGSTGLHSL